MLTLKCIFVGIIGCCLALIVLMLHPVLLNHRFEKLFDQYDKDIAKLHERG